MSKIKTYIVVFSGIFILLLFITWQQIAIFRLGYRITNLKKEIRNQEIKKQQIMEKLHCKWSLLNVEHKAKSSFNMDKPAPARCRILKIDKGKIFYKNKRKPVSFVSYLKEFISPSDAQAR